jgi:RNA polymerase sigma-70 factor (ECF subfamily)
MAASRFDRFVLSSPNAQEIDRLFRSEAARAVAMLGRIFRDFDRAEDAVQGAYALALTCWPRDGAPKNPAAWIMQTARNKAIDRLRREHVAAEKGEILSRLAAVTQLDNLPDDDVVDDRLAMIFAACHPALNVETRIALTLRYAAGLTVCEIAAALLVPPPTIAQRLVRAKNKVRRAGIAFAVPDITALAERLHDVLHVLYLIFNEGYASSTHPVRVRGELCDEALRLVRLLDELLPEQPEIAGLLALMLFHDARRRTRIDASGTPILLEHQDRAQWDSAKIRHGLMLLARDAPSRPGPYRLQASIAAEHARAVTWRLTNWRKICEYYDRLIATHDSPVVRLNRAVAIAHAIGPEAGLALLEDLHADETLGAYPQFFSARAELLRRVHRPAEACEAYRRAVQLTRSEPERRFLDARIQDLISQSA